MKLAIVEDDINMRKSLEIALGEYSEFEVVSFKSAKDALKKLDGPPQRNLPTTLR